jgi:hypothetical protein
MLCDKCQNIDFKDSALIPNTAEIYYDADEEGPDYYVYAHHPSLEALFHSSNLGCHFCRQIRQGLFHIRGHESDEAHHNGPVEIRYYTKDDGENAVYPKGLQAVAKTPVRDVKIPFDVVQYSRKSDPMSEIT